MRQSIPGVTMSTAFDEQAEAEKLRQVRALIEDILREFDVAASVFLVGRGRLETFQRVDPSWSVLHMEDLPDGHQGLRLRSKLADYAGDIARQKREQEWSVGIVHGLAETMARTSLAWLSVAQFFDKRTGAEHIPLRKDDPRDDPANGGTS
jgi:hypothetical protein